MVTTALGVPMAHGTEFHPLQLIVILSAVLIPAVALTITLMVGGREKK